MIVSEIITGGNLRNSKTNNEELRFKPNDIVKHFKRETLNDKDTNEYLYEIITLNARSTDDYKRQVVYKALYENSKNDIHYGDVFIRDYDEFMSKVDKDKYPDIKQEYRFELCYRRN